MEKKLLHKIAMTALLVAVSHFANAQGVSVNTTNADPDPSAVLDVSSTTQGMLIPRMTAALRGLIATPATGLMVYQTDAPEGFYFYNGSSWISLSTTTGTVTNASVATANGFAGSVATSTTTPAITLSTTVTGMLKGDGTAISAASSSDLPAVTLTGDVTGSASGGSVATTIDVNKVTYAKIQQEGASSLLGNPTGATANVSQITLGTGLSFAGTTLVNSAPLTFATPAANSVTLSAPTAGVATTAMRSDATLQLSQSIAPTWTGLHTFQNGITTTGAAALSFGADASAQTISLGTGAAAKTVSVGSSNGTSATNVLSGTGGANINVSNNQPTNINTGTSTGTVNVGGTGAMSINVGTGGTGAKTISIGDGASTGTTTIQSGSGGVKINSGISNNTNINDGASTGTVNIGGTGAMGINIGAAGTGAKTINIGDGASTGATVIKAGTGGIQIGTNGLPISAIIKTSATFGSFSLAASSTVAATVTLPTLSATATAIVTLPSTFPNAIVLASTKCVAGTLTFVLWNAGASAQNIAGTYFITIIQ